MQIIIDPEFKDLIPPLSTDERLGLEKSIANEGCRDPLVVWPNGAGATLIDGHNRYEICERLGVKFKTTEREFSDRNAASVWILDNQMNRRNLPMIDRVDCVRKKNALIESLQAEAAKRMRSGKIADPQATLPQGQTRDALAKVAGVSGRTYDKTVAVLESADEKTLQKIRNNETSVNAVYNVLKKKKDKKKRAAHAAAVAKSLPAITERYRLYACDLLDAPIEDASVDWVITDPPYPEEFLGVYSKLSEFSARVLKPGGSLICMIGQSFLPRIVAMLGERMTYHWTLAYLTPGGQSVQLWTRNVNTFWKPLLWYVKGEYEGRWAGDVCRSDVNDNDKRFHGWGQSESGMADIIESITEPGQIICDPFVGGGATAYAALKRKRLFVGIDIDEESIQKTKARINA